MSLASPDNVESPFADIASHVPTHQQKSGSSQNLLGISPQPPHNIVSVQQQSADPHESTAKWTPFASMNKTTKLVVYALGIFICYFYYGIVQEKITRGQYGEQKERFTYTFGLVFCQCVVNAIFAKIILATVMPQGRDNTKSLYYAASSFTYLAAMVTSNRALLFVNYPTQVVGKSCKPIPVMILGVLIGHKRYSLRKYLFVLMIVVGVALFIYKDGKGAGVADAGSSLLGMGEILLIVSLAMDGFTGAIQDRMRAEYQSKSGHMMLSMNLWSILFSGVVLILTGEGLDFLHFLTKYPAVIYDLTFFSVGSAVGQFFIFLTVSEFGPLSCSIVTTTRKFFTVLGSVVIFGNHLSSRQWFGTVFVFAGLTLDSLYGKG